MAILARVPKYCHIARRFGTNHKEALRQLKVWRKDIGHGIASDWTVHLYHTKTIGWALVLCKPDYNPNKRK